MALAPMQHATWYSVALLSNLRCIAWTFSQLFHVHVVSGSNASVRLAHTAELVCELWLRTFEVTAQRV